METIVWANDLPGRDAVLEVGQSLIIPPVSGVLYTVERGDSLASIGTAYGVSAAEIAEANGLDPAAVLSIGTQLVIPGAAPGAYPDAGSPQARPSRARRRAPACGGGTAAGRRWRPSRRTAPEIVSIAAAYVATPHLGRQFAADRC